MKIYIAGPFFDERERTYLNRMIITVQQLFPKAELFIPMTHEIPNAWELPNSVWAKKVYDMDVAAINSSDIVIAMYTGHYSDTGTVWEMGYAYSKGIPVIGYIPEWAKAEDMSLMVMNCLQGKLDADQCKIVTLSDSILNQINQK